VYKSLQNVFLLQMSTNAPQQTMAVAVRLQVVLTHLEVSPVLVMSDTPETVSIVLVSVAYRLW
jgi:uncharacterized protein YeaC (DUF1315 family)